MVESSDARRDALDRMVAGVLGGGPVDVHEGQLLDCKEDPSRRARRGAVRQGDARSDDTARMVADAVACFANAHGGVVVIGVDDKAVGEAAFAGTDADIAWLKNRVRQLVAVEVDVAAFPVGAVTLVAVTVDPSAVPVIDTAHRYRRRQGRDCQEMSGAELGSFSVERTGADWSATPTAHSAANADPAALAQLRTWLRQSPEPSRAELADLDNATLLRHLSLADGTGRLNRAGELLCVELPGRQPLIDLTCRAAPGADTQLRLDPPSVPLAVVLAEVEAAIQARNPRVNVAVGLTAGPVPALPDLALREALVNAVMHRDWSSPEPIRVQLEGTQLTVSSPGGFLAGINAANLITTPPRTRNPQLARSLRGLRLAEAEGIGVDRMFRETVRVGLPTPDIEELPEATGVRCVLLGGDPDRAVMAVVGALPGPLVHDIDVLLILDALERRPTINATQLAPVIQKTQPEALAALARAGHAGLIVETPRNGYWRLGEPARRALAHRLGYMRRTEADYARVIAQLLANHGEVRARDLIEVCGIGQVQASRVLAQAVEAGLVCKQPSADAVGAGVYYIAV